MKKLKSFEIITVGIALSIVMSYYVAKELEENFSIQTYLKEVFNTESSL